ncbi:MAG: response regulator [Gemmatimonadetes bacterium]|jgi:CheY-like chemotaxis protein|nr:response regulator [Gemmatimonadota bacterium]
MSASTQAGTKPAKKVLIVDDEPDVAGYLEMLLRDSGYDTATVGDGAAALESVRKEPPDLVTLDISMPKASGTRFYKEVRTDPALASIPVIIVTAVTGYGGDAHGYEKFISSRSMVPPPEGFFPKPIDREEFLAAVEKLLIS